MYVRKILLVDNDSKNIKILQETFAEKQYKMDHASSDREAYQRAEQHPYDVVLSEIYPPKIDGHRLLEKLQRNPNTANIPLIFLTKKSDIWNRIRSFRLGAKDFIVKPIHVMEIIARVEMVLSRFEKRDEEETLARKKFVGRLEDLSIADLIETFGVERKTGVLTVNNENGLIGQIFFKSGAVVNANTNGLKAEEAVYKMMGWGKGRFSMLFKDVNIADEVSISNLGLLIQGIKRMQSRDAILSQLPSVTSVLVTTTNFKKIIGQKNLTPDLKHFLSLFDGERTIARIIDESSYDDLTTLERILKLYRLGFLRTLRGKVREIDKLEPTTAEDTVATIPPHEEQPSFDTTLAVPATPEDEKELLPATAPTDEMETWDKPVTEAVFSEMVEEGVGLGLEPPPEDETSLFAEFETADLQSTDIPANDKVEVTAQDVETASSKLPEEAPIHYQPSVEAEKPSVLEEEPIVAVKPVETPKKEHFAPQPEQIHPRFKLARAHVLIIGPDRLGRKDIVNALVEGQGSTMCLANENLSDIYFGTVLFKGGHHLNIMGVSTDNEFTPLIDYLAPRTIGYVLLIDLKEPDTWDYLGYLIRTLDGKLDVPSLLASRISKDEAKSLVGNLQTRLSLSDSKRLYVCESFDTISTKRMIFALFGVEKKRADNIHVVQRGRETQHALM